MEKNEQDLVDRLKDFATVQGKQRTWVSLLSDTQLYELFLRLRNGEKSRLIARHAHAVWKVNPSSTVHSLSQGITKFKKRIAHLLVSPLPANHVPCLENTDTECNLETLVALSDEIERRIKKIIMEEERSGVRFPINKEINALSSLRKTILKEKQWELMHGNDDPIHARRQQGLEKQNELRFDKLLNSLPDEGANIVRIAQRFLEGLDELSIPYQWDEKKKKYIPIEAEESKD